MTFDEFNQQMIISLEDICWEIFHGDNATIKVKNPKIGIKKLIKIIEAALKISNEKGFHAMGLRELCKECGMSMGGLYAYIDTKEDLLKIMHDQGRRVLKSLIAQKLISIDHPQDKLDLAIRLHLFLSEKMQPWFYFSYMETRFFSQDVKKISMSNELYTESIFKEIVEQGCQNNLFKQVDPLFTASIIKAMLQDWYLKRWKYKNRNISVDQYADFVIDWTHSFLNPAS